jgi:hypothetical protein
LVLDVISNANFKIDKITANNIITLNVNHNKTISCWVLLFDQFFLDFMDNNLKNDKMKKVSKKKGWIGYNFKENFIKLKVCLNLNQLSF